VREHADQWMADQREMALESVWFYARRAMKLGATDDEVAAQIVRALAQVHAEQAAERVSA
jgi:hypothetical protein